MSSHSDQKLLFGILGLILFIIAILVFIRLSSKRKNGRILDRSLEEKRWIEVRQPYPSDDDEKYIMDVLQKMQQRLEKNTIKDHI